MKGDGDSGSGEVNIAKGGRIMRPYPGRGANEDSSSQDGFSQQQADR